MCTPVSGDRIPHLPPAGQIMAESFLLPELAIRWYGKCIEQVCPERNPRLHLALRADEPGNIHGDDESKFRKDKVRTALQGTARHGTPRSREDTFQTRAELLLLAPSPPQLQLRLRQSKTGDGQVSR